MDMERTSYICDIDDLADHVMIAYLMWTADSLSNHPIVILQDISIGGCYHPVRDFLGIYPPL